MGLGVSLHCILYYVHDNHDNHILVGEQSEVIFVLFFSVFYIKVAAFRQFYLDIVFVENVKSSYKRGLYQNPKPNYLIIAKRVCE